MVTRFIFPSGDIILCQLPRNRAGHHISLTHLINTSARNTPTAFLITTAKVSGAVILFICLSVNRIMQKLLA